LGRHAVIVLDTHIWLWWVDGATQLPQVQREFIQNHEPQGLGVSAISCWEVAMLVGRGRIALPLPVGEWIARALQYPGMSLLELSPEIAVESTQLPGTFHRDPADQILVATARIHGCPLVTLDQKIRAYPHVILAP